MASPKARRNTTIIAALCYLVSIPFLIVVILGNTRRGTVLSDIYFYKLDVSHIIPISVENSNLLNSVARSLGLHDFYQVGLWNFCEGYDDQGITDCSSPVQFYWFNPVHVLLSELLAGAKIALPSQAVTVLDLLKLGSQIMYGFFLAGTVLNLVLLFTTPLVIRTRWFSLLLSFFAALASILVSVAAIIASVISIAFKVALTAQDQLDIVVTIGTKMFAFMWIAAIATDLAFLLHAAMGCCCKPQKRRAAQESPRTSEDEKVQKPKLPQFMRLRGAVATSPRVTEELS